MFPTSRPAAQIAVGAIFDVAALPERGRLRVRLGHDCRLELRLGVPILGAEGRQFAPVFLGQFRDLRDLREPRANLAGPNGQAL